MEILLSQKRSLRQVFCYVIALGRFFFCFAAAVVGKRIDPRGEENKRWENRERPEQTSLSLSVWGRGLRYVKRPDLDDRQIIIIKKNHLNSTGIFLFVWYGSFCFFTSLFFSLFCLFVCLRVCVLCVGVRVRLGAHALHMDESGKNVREWEKGAEMRDNYN